MLGLWRVLGVGASMSDWRSQCSVFADLDGEGEGETLRIDGARRSGKSELLLQVVARLVDLGQQVIITTGSVAEMEQSLSRLRGFLPGGFDVERITGTAASVSMPTVRP